MLFHDGIPMSSLERFELLSARLATRSMVKINVLYCIYLYGGTVVEWYGQDEINIQSFWRFHVSLPATFSLSPHRIPLSAAAAPPQLHTISPPCTHNIFSLSEGLLYKCLTILLLISRSHVIVVSLMLLLSLSCGHWKFHPSFRRLTLLPIFCCMCVWPLCKSCRYASQTSYLYNNPINPIHAHMMRFIGN